MKGYIVITAAVLTSAILIFAALVLIGFKNDEKMEDEKIWTIEEFTWIKDQSLTVDGSLFVDFYATLMLENVELMIEGDGPDPPMIYVQGKIILYDCTISGSGFGFYVPGQIIANNTGIQGIGTFERNFMDRNMDVDGLTFDSGQTSTWRTDDNIWDPYSDGDVEHISASLLTNCSIHDCVGSGIFIKGSTVARDKNWTQGMPVSEILRGTEISNCSIGIRSSGSGFPLMDGCIIHHCETGFQREGSNHEIRDARLIENHFHDNGIAISLGDGRFGVINNTIEKNHVGLDISETWHGIDYYLYEYQRIIGNHFRYNDVAVKWIQGTTLENCSFLDNKLDINCGDACIIDNNTFMGSDVGINCMESSPMIDNCSFHDVERGVYIESFGHPRINKTDLDIERIFWGFYNDWSELNSTVIIDGITYQPDRNRSEYLGERTNYDPWEVDDWD